VQVAIQVKSSLNNSVAGIWNVTIFCESLTRGPGDLKLAEAQSEGEIPAGPAERSFSWDLPVKPEQLPEGAYKLATIAFFSPRDEQRSLVAGFTDGPIIEIYDALT
jgi:hypothetical protein